MQYKIIVDKQSRTNPSAEKKEYIIDIEELRYKGDIYDSLVITKDEDYVLRRLKLTEFYVLEELEEPIKEPLENINIELFEGDNYIYLMDMVGNKFYAEYLVKNEFNDIYVTLNKMNSAINQSASEVEIAVNQKLEGYSTTEEMNSAIDLKANEINAKVEKKVDEETITGAYLILKINGDTSEAKLNADKIELSANDILNLLAGNAINLTSKNITINSNNFNVSSTGAITLKSEDGTDGGATNFNIIGDGAYVNLKAYRNRILLNNQTAKISASMGIGDATNGVSATIGVNGITGTDFVDMSIEDESGTALITVAGNGNYTYIKPSEVKTPKLTQTSLETQKKNFEKFNSNALDIIQQIELYKYNLKGEEDTDKKHIGFVIGDKYKYSKEITSNNNTGVDLYSFISVCCKAIQEQQEQINKLQSKIEKLEAKNEKESI